MRSRTEYLNHSPQSRGQVFSRWVIQIKPVLWRAPWPQAGNKLPVFEVRTRPIFPDICERNARKRSFDHEFVIVEGKRAGALELQLLASMTERPSVSCAAWIDITNARMTLEVCR